MSNIFLDPVSGLPTGRAQLAGRNVQELIGHNGIAITTTTNVNTPLIDVSTLGGRKNIYVLNTLNQSVVINVFSYPISGAGGVQIGTKTIASGNATITPTDIAMLGEPLQKILLQAVCSVAPTAGVITTYVEGVQS